MIHDSASSILTHLRSLKNPKNIEGMKRFGITGKRTLGIPVPVLRALAKKIGKNHEVALELWESGIHEARILASFIDDPKHVTIAQMEAWVRDFDSWDVCDQTCGLFDRTPHAWKLVPKWAKSDEEFVRRAGFALMATLAVHDKKATDGMFLPFFPLIERYADDERNFVKKAVNWALRQMGKRNVVLHKEAIETGEKLLLLDSKGARWIARDALRELRGESVLKRLAEKVKSR